MQTLNADRTQISTQPQQIDARAQNQTEQTKSALFSKRFFSSVRSNITTGSQTGMVLHPVCSTREHRSGPGTSLQTHGGVHRAGLKVLDKRSWASELKTARTLEHASSQADESSDALRTLHQFPNFSFIKSRNSSGSSKSSSSNSFCCGADNGCCLQILVIC